MITAIVFAIVVGAVLGVLARVILPGRQQISVVLTVVIGIVAALVGTFIARALGVGHTHGVNWIQLLIELVLAVIGVAIAAGASARRGTRA